MRPGAWADLVVFDPDTVDPGPLRRVADFPAGAERLTADQPTGMRHLLVNGTVVQRDGAFRDEVICSMRDAVVGAQTPAPDPGLTYAEGQEILRPRSAPARPASAAP